MFLFPYFQNAINRKSVENNFSAKFCAENFDLNIY